MPLINIDNESAEKVIVDGLKDNIKHVIDAMLAGDYQPYYETVFKSSNSLLKEWYMTSSDYEAYTKDIHSWDWYLAACAKIALI